MIVLIMGMVSGAWTYSNGGWAMVGVGICTIIGLEAISWLMGWDVGKLIVELVIDLN